MVATYIERHAPRNMHPLVKFGLATVLVTLALLSNVLVTLSALSGAKALIHDHISHCLDRPLKAPGATGRAALREFKAVARYL
jgi:hypothetical protein